MVEGPSTILGGLPVWVEITYTRGDGWTTDDDAEVSEMYWLKRDGTKGSPVTQKIWDKCDDKDPYWQCDTIEQFEANHMPDPSDNELMKLI